jgi:GntR family transcriptional regulator
MFLHLDRHTGVPVYRQIQDQVRILVAGGVLRAGDELPSTRALAAEAGLNPMTVSKAYSLLERDGVVERRPGLALVIRAQSEDERAAARREELRAALRPAVVAAGTLGIEAEDALREYRALLEAAGNGQEEA